MSPLTWLAAKKVCKKSWIWLKHHWKIVALVVLSFVVFCITRKNNNAILKVLESTVDSYKKQVGVLEKTHAEEVEKRNQEVETYHRVVAEIEEQYSKEGQKLDEAKKKRIKDLTKKHRTDPEEITRILTEEYGFTHVK